MLRSSEMDMFKKFCFILILLLIKYLLIPSYQCANEFPNSIKLYRGLVAEFSKKGIYINLYQFTCFRQLITDKIRNVIFFHFKEIGAGEFQIMGEGPKHISEDCIQQCAMLCLNIPGTYNDEHNGIGIYYRI